MATLILTDRDIRENNLLYIQTALSEVFAQTDCKAMCKQSGSRSALIIDCPIICYDLIKDEVDDKAADVIVVNYKYEFFKELIRPEGLNKIERELLLTSLIAADIDDDKKYVLDKLKHQNECALDGIFNFRLRPLKKKWEEIAEYMPKYFINTQLKEFISYLIDGKNKKVFVSDKKVYDSHYRRLTKSRLLSDGECDIVKEVILSNCGQIELGSKIPDKDEYYLKEFYGDKVSLDRKYFS